MIKEDLKNNIIELLNKSVKMAYNEFIEKKQDDNVFEYFYENENGNIRIKPSKLASSINKKIETKYFVMEDNEIIDFNNIAENYKYLLAMENEKEKIATLFVFSQNEDLEPLAVLSISENGLEPELNYGHFEICSEEEFLDNVNNDVVMISNKIIPIVKNKNKYN